MRIYMAQKGQYFILFVGLLSVPRSTGESKKVCYPETGCLSLGAPWTTRLRPFPPPYSPDQVNVEFYLHTRNTMSQPLLNLKVNMSNTTQTKKSLDSLNYRSGRTTTAFIIHGFSSNANKTWVRKMADAYLSKVDANVFLVDWGRGANGANYLQVASNTRVVGALLANFVQFLIDATNLRANQIHLIGHSLGSHIAGYVGKRIPNVNRITGLDVAQPGFEGHDPIVRLNMTDAQNIDVHHTDAEPIILFLGLGFMSNLGHIDFHYNGGRDQPGCTTKNLLNYYNITSAFDVMKSSVEAIAILLSCSHSKSYEYFTEALQRRDCVMWGTQDNLVTSALNELTDGKFQSILKSTCTLSTCSPTGLDTFKYPGRGSFHVVTSASVPYCSGQGVAQWSTCADIQICTGRFRGYLMVKILHTVSVSSRMTSSRYTLQVNEREYYASVECSLNLISARSDSTSAFINSLPVFLNIISSVPDIGIIGRMSREFNDYYQTRRNQVSTLRRVKKWLTG